MMVPSHVESDVRNFKGFAERCHWYALLIRAYPLSVLVIQTLHGRFLSEPNPGDRN